MSNLMSLCHPCLTQPALCILKEIGVKNAVDFVARDPSLLAAKSGIKYKDVIAIRNAIFEKSTPPFQNVGDLYEKAVSSLHIFSTGCKKLDDILQGGIYVGEIFEIIGLSSSGKTQLSFSVASTLASQYEKCVLYIDTNAGFSAQRLNQILNSRGVESQGIQQALLRIRCCSIHDVYSFMNLLDELYVNLKSQNDFTRNLKLIVLDSATNIFYPYLAGCQQDGHGIVSQAVQMMKKLCSEHAIALMLTNSVLSKETSIPRPAMGKYWQHIPSITVYLSKPTVITIGGIEQYGKKRLITILKSCREASNVTLDLKITDRGVEAA